MKQLLIHLNYQFRRLKFRQNKAECLKGMP